jgi:hypothetical protein
MADLHTDDEFLAELDRISMKTEQGSYVRMEDIRRLIDKKKEQAAEADEASQPKTLDAAREGAKRFLSEQGFGPKNPQEPGKAIPASEPQPPSRA